MKEDAEGNVLNNVVHTVTRFSDDPKQNYDQERLLEFALTCDPDVVCVGEMKSAEAFAAQEAARTGHAVITTTHANSCKATYYRMVTLCTQKYDMGDKTLYNLVTEAFPIVLFVKKLEDNSRRVMEITECEILEDGARQLHTLYRYHVSETAVEDGKIKVRGEFQKVSTISASLQKRLLENGMPPRLLEQYRRELDFYSCTVPALDQHVLARFLDQGHYEQHLARMRKEYRTRHDAVLASFRSSPFRNRITISEQGAGLHFLLRLDTRESDEALRDRAAALGVRLGFLSEYAAIPSPAYAHTLVVNYAGLSPAALPEAMDLLAEIFGA